MANGVGINQQVVGHRLPVLLNHPPFRKLAAFWSDESTGTDVSHIPPPQTIANDLMDRLVAMDAPNEIALRGFERDAEAVMDVDPAGAHTVLGTVAGIRSDADNVREHFRIALQHADSSVTYHNYSIALSLVDEWRDSLDAADTAHKKAPDNTAILDSAIKRAVEAGRFRIAHRYCNQLNALRPSDAPHALTGLLDQFVASLDAGAFGESNVERVLEIAGSIQRTESVPSTGISAKLDQDEPHSFLFRRFVTASPEMAATLNSTLADEIVSHDDLVEDPCLLFVHLFVGVDD